MTTIVVALGLACGEAPAPVATDEDAPAPATRRSIDPRLGDLSELPPRVRRAFEAAPEDWPDMPVPGNDDWLAFSDEEFQSVGAFWVSNPNRPGAAGRNTLYIQPLGPLPGVEALRAYAADFFAMPVLVRPAASLEAIDATRRGKGAQEQLLAPDLQSYLRSNLPEDAYAMIGLTMADLYPGEGWNYVFGLASPVDRTGIFSFRRYDPRFYDERAAPNPSLATERAMKIMTHEIGHMFGMQHCRHHRCLMNGANHAEELDGAPVHLCPVCLRKLHMQVEFDPATRYRALATHYARAGLGGAARFVGHRIAVIEEER